MTVFGTPTAHGKRSREGADRGRGWTRPLVALVGVAVLLITIVVAMHTPSLSLQKLPLGVPAGSNAIDVRMYFERADRVNTGTEVRYGELIVGRVASVETNGEEAIITTTLDSELADIPGEPFAEIRQPTALGSPFVAIEPPQNPGTHVLGDGDSIPRFRTAIGPDLESSLATVGMLLNGSGIEQFKTVMSELSTALDGKGEALDRISDRGDRMLELYELHRQDINDTMDTLGRITDALHNRRELLDKGMAVSADVVTQVAANRDQLDDLLGTTVTLSAQLRTFVDSTGANYTPLLDQTRTLLEDMQTLEGEAGPILVKLTEFVDLFNDAAPGDYLAFDGALDVPGSLDSLYSGGMARGAEPDGGGEP